MMTNYKDPIITDIARHFKIRYDEAEIICDLANSGNKLALAHLDGYAESCEANVGTRPDLNMAKNIASQFRRAREEERQQLMARPFCERHPNLAIALMMLTIIVIVYVIGECRSGGRQNVTDSDMSDASEYDIN